MSVRVGDRQKGKLQVLYKARVLKRYTLAILKNTKYFPKSTRWLYASPIQEEIRAACSCIKRATATYVTDTITRDIEYKYRASQQIEAYAHLEALVDLVEDVYLANYISGRQTEHWTKLIVEVEQLVKSWERSDKDKFMSKG